MAAVKELMTDAEASGVTHGGTIVVLYRGNRGLYDWATTQWWDSSNAKAHNHLGRTEIARMPILEAAAQRDAFNAMLDMTTDDKWNN